VTSRPQSEHGLPLAPGDLTRGRLPAPSWVRIDRIVTLNVSLVVKVVGHVSDRIMAAAVGKFCAYIGYPETP
jgi:hypothetical protein